MVGVTVAWIVPLFLGATMFPGNVRAETLRISGTARTPTKTFFLVTRQAPSPNAGRFIRVVRSPEGKAILSRVGHIPLL